MAQECLVVLIRRCADIRGNLLKGLATSNQYKQLYLASLTTTVPWCPEPSPVDGMTWHIITMIWGAVDNGTGMLGCTD
jgi:hypothetical protein